MKNLHKLLTVVSNNIWILGTTFFVLFIYNFPHILSSFTTPDGFVYLKQAAWFDHWDQNLYVSAIKYAQNNGYEYANTYTTLPHKSFVLFPLYTATGSLIKFMDPFYIFHLLNISVGILLIVTMYASSNVFLKDNKKSIFVTLLASLAGGLGWIVSRSYLAPDIRMPYFTMLTTFQRAHEGLAVTMFFAALTLLFLYLSKGKLNQLIASSVLLAITLRSYPFLIANYYFILGLWLIWNKFKTNKLPIRSKVNAMFIPFLVSFPVLIYTLYLMFTSSSFETVIFHPDIPTITPLGALIGYGVMGFVFTYQLIFTKKSQEMVFINIWFLGSLVLSFLPLEFSRYFLRGQFFPLSIILIYTISQQKWNKGIRKNMTYIFILIFIPFSTYIVFIMRLLSPYGFNSKWNYVKKSDMRMINTLIKEENCSVISDFRTSNIIPAYTVCNVYVGHTNQTPESEEKRELAKKIINGELNQEEAIQIIKENQISHILSTDQYWDNEFSGNKNLEEIYSFIELIHREDNSSLYAVKNTNLNNNDGGDGGS